MVQDFFVSQEFRFGCDIGQWYSHLPNRCGRSLINGGRGSSNFLIRGRGPSNKQGGSFSYISIEIGKKIQKYSAGGHICWEFLISGVGVGVRLLGR